MIIQAIKNFQTQLTKSVNCVILLLTGSVNKIEKVSFLEKFLSLPIDKQDIIVNAALTCFGINGYKKTSISDIAAAAGISKALIFHYFHLYCAVHQVWHQILSGRYLI